MSAVLNLATLTDEVRTAARADAGAATIIGNRHAAADLARSLGLPLARFAVSLDARRVCAGWDTAEHILIVARTAGEPLVPIIVLDTLAGVSEAEADFGLAGAPEGRLAPDALSNKASIHVPAALLDAALARHSLIAETLHLAVVQGTLDGFLEQALDFLKGRSRPWYGAGIERATDDPHVLRALGLMFSRLHALDQLSLEAIAAVAEALDAERVPDSVRELDLARHYAQRSARSLVNEGIGLLGASSASGKHGFDRFWRDIAAHGLRHPPPKAAETLGRDFIRHGLGGLHPADHAVIT